MNERVIVSMTSYPGRIDMVGKTVFSILKNTMQPDLIVCNLSLEEFPNKENDLPTDLQMLIDSTIFEVNWVEKNTRQFKKIIPTLERFPNDVIISIDDDMLYPSKFIEIIYADYLKYDKKFPITAGHWIDKGYYNDKPSHHGSFSLVKRWMFGKNFDKIKLLIQSHLWKEIWFDDPLYTYAIMNTGLEYKLSTWNGFAYKKAFDIKGVSRSHFRERMIEHKYLKELFR